MGTRNTTDDAYNFCDGKAVKKNTSGEVVQKKTPYDWCAVTDHAEYFGVMPELSDPKSDLMTQNKDNEIIKLILSGDPKKGAEGSGQRKPRPRADHQGLVPERISAGEGLRRGLVR